MERCHKQTQPTDTISALLSISELHHSTAPVDVPQISPCARLVTTDMFGVEICEPSVLYNILNQQTHVSKLAEINYLFLIGK